MKEPRCLIIGTINARERSPGVQGIPIHESVGALVYSSKSDRSINNKGSWRTATCIDISYWQCMTTRRFKNHKCSNFTPWASNTTAMLHLHTLMVYSILYLGSWLGMSQGGEHPAHPSIQISDWLPLYREVKAAAHGAILQIERIQLFSVVPGLYSYAVIGVPECIEYKLDCSFVLYIVLSIVLCLIIVTSTCSGSIL